MNLSNDQVAGKLNYIPSWFDTCFIWYNFIGIMTQIFIVLPTLNHFVSWDKALERPRILPLRLAVLGHSSGLCASCAFGPSIASSRGLPTSYGK